MDTIIFQEHSSVLPEWKRRELQGITLIYLDAHIDLQFVNQERIEALRRCNTADELARLEKPHHMKPDLGYSFSIEDFLYPAHRLGIVEQLIWVTPPKENVDNREPQIQEIFQELSMMEGVSPEDLASFDRIDNILKGKAFGLDVTICSYEDLAQLQIPSNSLIDVDVDYFIALPSDEPWIDPKIVFSSLQKLSLTSNFVTLTRSVSSGHTPLRYSFFTDYLAALWQEDRRQSEHYSRLFHLDSQWRKGNRDTAKAGYLKEIQDFPDCAATYYLLSLVETQPALTQQYAQKAAELDSQYAPNVLRSISELANRGLKFEQAKLQELENQLAASNVNPEDLAIAHSTLGILYSQLEDLPSVFRHHSAYKKLLPRHPQLNLKLGSLLLKAGHDQRAASFLHMALQDETSSYGAHSLLGGICIKQRDFQQACTHFLKVSELRPAFSEPINVLAHLYKKMGDEVNAQVMHRKYQQMQFSAAIIAQKLKK